MGFDTGIPQDLCGPRDQFRIGVGIIGGRLVVIAGAFIAQGALDQDIIGRRRDRFQLPGRGYADQ